MGAFEHKFPRTPHLWGSRASRDDRVLSREESAALLARPLIVEEKVDGANLGVSFDEEGARPVVQNRGHLLGRGEHAQFAPVWGWLAEREAELREALGPHRILFGEWLYARHSVAYDALPDWFLGFDLYDKRERAFLSRVALEELASHARVSLVPQLARAQVFRTLEAVADFVGPSRVATGQRAEGLVLREERDGRVSARAKWVRPDFIAGITEHWRSRPVEPNKRAR